jgi:ATP-dependent Clp protease ATP-binding subunit ClpA
VLPKEVIQFITRCQLNKVNKDLLNADVTLKLVMDDTEIDKLVEFQYKPERGARGIDGIFRTNVYPRLARIIKTGEAVDKVTITFNDGEFDLATSIG